VVHVSRLGVEAITGKPYKPTTQGKNERFHQTLFRYLDKQPLADTLAELQAQVDAFDRIYNTERPHQGLPGRVTPQMAWHATEKVEAPRPNPERPLFVQTAAKPPRPARVLAPTELPSGTYVRKLTTAGSFTLAGVHYMVGGRHGLQQVLIITKYDRITVADLDGEVLIEHTRPAAGVIYVGNGRPRGPRPASADTSPKS